MKFWIVTPSYNQLEWLKLCILSVADQCSQGLEVHHHIQDAESDDGTKNFLHDYFLINQQCKADNYSFSYSSEKDKGMYDAINRGWKLAPDDVDIMAHLNCDEQYLPNALRKISHFFLANEKVDVVLADVLIVNKDGEYICHRRSLKPYSYISKLWCAGFTASTFHRLHITRERNVYFNIRWKNIGDKVWYNTLHASQAKFRVYNEIVSTFTDTGKNLNWTEQGRKEGLIYMREILPCFKENIQFLKKLSVFNALRRRAKEFILRAPKNYSIYVSGSSIRKFKVIKLATASWSKNAWN